MGNWGKKKLTSTLWISAIQILIVYWVTLYKSWKSWWISLPSCTYLIVSFPLGNLDGTKLHRHLLWRISLKWLPSNKYLEVFRNFFESFSLHESKTIEELILKSRWYSFHHFYHIPLHRLLETISLYYEIFITSSVQKLSSIIWLPLLDYGKSQRCGIHFWFRVFISFTARVTFSNRHFYFKSFKAKGVVNDTPVDRPNERATRYLVSFSSPCATQSGIAKSTLYPSVFLIWI